MLIILSEKIRKCVDLQHLFALLYLLKLYNLLKLSEILNLPGSGFGLLAQPLQTRLRFKTAILLRPYR